MTKKTLLTIAFAIAHFVCLSQTPNAVPMVLEPLPEDEWYLNIWGFYGHQDYETNSFVRDSVDLRSAYFLGMVGDKTVEWGLARLYNWGGSEYEMDVVTDLGTSNKFALDFTLRSEDSPFAFDEDDEWANFARTFRAFAIVQGQPMGFRFFDKGETEPFKVVMFEDPGEPPKLWMVETVFVPSGIEYDPDFAPGSIVLEWDGEGIDGGITPHTVTDEYTDISYDGGVTWKSWRSLGKQVFPPEQLAQNPHPIIKVTAYHRMRRYVKYYTYKKGFSDAPGGPYEPITVEELQKQGNGKKTGDNAGRNKAKTDVASTETATDRPKSIIDKSGADEGE